MIKSNDRILSLALAALRAERAKIDEEIVTIERRLGKRSPALLQGTRSNRLSAQGRKNISDAMKKRWAERRALKAKQARRGRA